MLKGGCAAAKWWTSTPGIEPGIFRSVGGRLIHWAMRNEAQEDYTAESDANLLILCLYLYAVS